MSGRLQSLLRPFFFSLSLSAVLLCSDLVLQLFWEGVGRKLGEGFRALRTFRVSCRLSALKSLCRKLYWAKAFAKISDYVRQCEDSLCAKGKPLDVIRKEAQCARKVEKGCQSRGGPTGCRQRAPRTSANGEGEENGALL